MQNDLKTGMVLGLVLTAGAAIWLSTWPSLSVKSRMPTPGFATENKRTTPLKSDGPGTQQPPAVPIAETIHPQSTAPVSREDTEKVKTPAIHIVRDGETLSDISYKYYGSAGKWQKILDANRQLIEDANKLKTGSKLTIPD